MGEDEVTKITRLKLYFGSLLPLDPNVVAKLDKSRIDISKNQLYICTKDIHREIFCTILLEIGKAMGRRPSYRMATLNELIESHFDEDHPSTEQYLFKDVLLILCVTATLENKIYGPVLDKIIEERKAINKPTFVFYKGNIQKFNQSMKAASADEIIDFNTMPRSATRRNEVL